jgi:hypothetical protein
VREYDPKTCITAAELRGLGVFIPEGIPDCAWAPRAAVHVDQGEVAFDGDMLHWTATVRIDAPLRWVEVKLEVGS